MLVMPWYIERRLCNQAQGNELLSISLMGIKAGIIYHINVPARKIAQSTLLPSYQEFMF